jgi:hypothetical protein
MVARLRFGPPPAYQASLAWNNDRTHTWSWALTRPSG